MHYRAKSLSSAFEVEEQVLEAADEAEVRRVIEAGGARLLSATPVRGALSAQMGGARFNLPVFNQQLCSLLEAGQPVVDALEILGRNDARGRYRRVYDTLLLGLRNGKQLSEAMAAIP